MKQPSFVFELTRRCSSKCAYCYNVWKHVPGYPLGELALRDIGQLFDRLMKQVQPAGVTLLGGEPTLAPTLVATANELCGRGLSVAISTRGTGLDEGLIDRLLTAGVRSFELSLDSADPAVATSLGSAASPARRALLALAARGAHVTVSAVLCRATLYGLTEVAKLGVALGASGLSLLRLVQPTAGVIPPELAVSAPELTAALAAVDRVCATYELPAAVSIPLEACQFAPSLFPHLQRVACVCGDGKWAIDPAGNLRICEVSPQILGNLNLIPFSELIASEPVAHFRAYRPYDECADCDFWRDCRGGCRYLVTDDERRRRPDG